MGTGLLCKAQCPAQPRPLPPLGKKHLIKFDLKDISQDPPATSHVLGTKISQHEVKAPGEAVLLGSSDWKILRLCSLLFSDIAGQFVNYFFHEGHPVALHQKIRRDYPLPGDSACAIWEDDELAQSAILMVRPQETGGFNALVVIRVAEDRFANWATFQFRMLLESARKTAHYLLNRRGISRLREVDEDFYTVLSIQSFKRGMPMLPMRSPNEPWSFSIDAGERLGLKYWARFQPATNPKFRLAEYMKLFLFALGHDLETYDAFDGRELVPYQCVMRRDHWEMVKPRFFEVYPLAKTAYRRANGGSSAPGVHQDVEPKYLVEEPTLRETAKEPKLIVRNTFLDVEDDEELARQAERHVRNARRPKTAMVFPVYVECE